LPKSEVRRTANDDSVVCGGIDRPVTEFLACGRRESDVELRKVPQPATNLFPDETASDMTGELASVVAHVMGFIEEQSLRALETVKRATLPSPEIVEVRKPLSGRTVALVGGTPRQRSASVNQGCVCCGLDYGTDRSQAQRSAFDGLGDWPSVGANQEERRVGSQPNRVGDSGTGQRVVEPNDSARGSDMRVRS